MNNAEDVILGSPPHTWGKEKPCDCSCCIRRITPTYVGKSCIPSNDNSKTTDHPHIRGEKLPVLNIHVHAVGSPPHTWGKVVCAPSGKSRVRITPTYVGKRGISQKSCGKGLDHPHIRGEKSPRNLFYDNAIRITPTYVGKSFS